jgi:hypothetical protein
MSLPTPPAEGVPQPEHPPVAAPHAGYETRDVNIRGVLWLAAGTVVLVAVVQAGIWLFLQSQQTAARQADPATPRLATEPHEPPPPRLQAAPSRDYAQFKQAQEELLSTYGWVDRERGVVRIPISRAMDLVLEGRRPSPANSADQPQ